MGAGELRGFNDPLDRHGRIRQCDVVTNRLVEKDVLLQHRANLAAQPRRINHREVHAIDQHAAAFGNVEALDELGHRALARTRGSDDADDLSGGYAKTDVVQHLRPVDAVTKHNMVERHVAANGRQRGTGRIEPGFRRRVENIAEPLHREPCLVKILPDLGEPQYRLAHASRQHIEGDQFAHGQVAGDDQSGTEIQNGGRNDLVDELHAVAGRVAEPQDPEARRHIAGELLFPASLHLRFDRHRLEGLDPGDAFHQKGLALGAALEFFVEQPAKPRCHPGRNPHVERESSKDDTGQ
ncbi:hypothetical protein GALL_441820 [mine drainage metagenome]|uniref:Uncharacterized protein n=1 Tax=mine drainage metagenome TaxID=410659 RepID=A0A1J5Q2S2_9ZZZZ